jgi:predicted PurR-regulated permease PerM
MVVLFMALTFAAAWACRTTLLSLFAGIVCATAMKPFIARLARAGLPGVAAMFVAYALALAMLVAAVFVLLPPLVDQVASLVEGLPDTYRTARDQLLAIDSQLVRRVTAELPESWPSHDAPVDLDAAKEVLGYGRWLFDGLLVVGAVAIFAFSWSLYEERTLRSFVLLLPDTRREAAKAVIARVQDNLSAYVRGQAFLCMLMALVDFIVFRLIGLPYAFPLALVAGLMEGIPFFGPIVGPVPAALVALSVSPVKAIWVVGAAIVIQQIEGYVLAPRVMHHAMGVHGFVMLLAIAGFGALMGVVGAVLAIPLAAVVQVLLDQFLFRWETPGPAGRISYRLRELLRDVQTQIRGKEAAPVTDGHDQLEETIEAIAWDLDRHLTEAFTGRPAGATVVQEDAR